MFNVIVQDKFNEVTIVTNCVPSWTRIGTMILSSEVITFCSRNFVKSVRDLLRVVGFKNELQTFYFQQAEHSDTQSQTFTKEQTATFMQ